MGLDDTYAVFKITFATGPHSLGKHTGPDIFHFVVFLFLPIIIPHTPTKVVGISPNLGY